MILTDLIKVVAIFSTDVSRVRVSNKVIKSTMTKSYVTQKTQIVKTKSTFSNKNSN